MPSGAETRWRFVEMGEYYMSKLVGESQRKGVPEDAMKKTDQIWTIWRLQEEFVVATRRARIIGLERQRGN